MGKKANAGDPLVIGATDWNNARDAGADYVERRALGERNPPRYSQPIDHVICKVRNDSGADRSRGDVLELGTYLLTDPDNHYPWFEGETPDTTRLSFAILQEPIKSGEIGKAFIAGVGYAVVNVTDAAHKFAAVESAAYKLKSATSGPVKILHKPAGTGNKDCMVQFNDQTGGGVKAVIYSGNTWSASSPLTSNDDGTKAYVWPSTGSVYNSAEKIEPYTYTASPVSWNVGPTTLTSMFDVVGASGSGQGISAISDCTLEISGNLSIEHSGNSTQRYDDQWSVTMGYVVLNSDGTFNAWNLCDIGRFDRKYTDKTISGTVVVSGTTYTLDFSSINPVEFWIDDKNVQHLKFIRTATLSAGKKIIPLFFKRRTLSAGATNLWYFTLGRFDFSFVEIPD